MHDVSITHQVEFFLKEKHRLKVNDDKRIPKLVYDIYDNTE